MDCRVIDVGDNFKILFDGKYLELSGKTIFESKEHLLTCLMQDKECCIETDLGFQFNIDKWRLAYIKYGELLKNL